MNHCGFFGRKLADDELKSKMTIGNNINYTVAALRMAKKANAVSKLHAKVSERMWKDYEGTSKIVRITNAQNQYFWQDKEIKKAWKNKNYKNFTKRKTELKNILFEEVLHQTGKVFDP